MRKCFSGGVVFSVLFFSTSLARLVLTGVRNETLGTGSADLMFQEYEIVQSLILAGD